jgi:hypothetical protein
MPRRKKDEPPPLKRGGRYFFEWEGPEPLPGVTTVLGRTVNKPALIHWAAKKGAKAALDDPTLSIEEAALAHRRTTEAASEKGQTLHAAFEGLQQGVSLEDIEENMKGDLKGAVRALKDWVETFSPKFLFQEVFVVNSTYGYAGTIDGVAIDIAGRPFILDYKTGREIYEDMDVQLSGYFGGEYLVDPATREKIDFDMSDIEYAMLVHLKPNGAWQVRKAQNKFIEFISYLHLYRDQFDDLECRKACYCQWLRAPEDQNVVVGLAESAARVAKDKAARAARKEG